MTIVTLVLPDFLLIALGWALLHMLKYRAEFFSTAERLVYYILFPALLFSSIVKAPLSIAEASTLIGATAALMGGGVALAWLAAPVLRPDPMIHASLAQCAYRFNTYIGLSLSLSLAGTTGQSIMAVIVGCAVPLANIAAVSGLARRQNTRVSGELVRNPLILGTVAGLTCNLMGLEPPGFVMDTLGRLGACALALGLICVGATLSIQGLGPAAKVMGWMIVVRLLAMPVVALVIAAVLPLSALEKQMLLLFSTLPTASSTYILAVRMGGDGRSVAVTMSVGTILSGLTIPLWMHFSPF
ncbi:MAG TPA: AEC family transporter [Burkholderiaceae bacterium]|nr:AEC family transporter [bacterium SGD-2]HZH56385.1 AEC family transporter [Burkholderiaceae bacterium]